MLSRMMALSAGIALVAFLHSLPPILYALALLPLSMLLATRYQTLVLLPWLLAGLCWGVAYGQHRLNSQLPPSLEGRPLLVEGKVSGLPVTRSGYEQPLQRFELQLTAPMCETVSGQCHSNVNKLRLSWYHPRPPLPGQHWRFTIKAKQPRGMANPGGFDYRAWLLQQGMGATGYVLANGDNRLLFDNAWGIDRWRWQLSRYLDKQLATAKHRALLKALLIADKSEISGDQWQRFANTGTTHLMVISGLHIGLVAGLGYGVGFIVALLLGARATARWAAIAAIVAALVYALAAGLSLPTQRALVMISVLMLALLFRRQLALHTGLWLALTLCLVLDPLAVISLSFWLSFTAVAAILFCASGRLGYRPRLSNWYQPQYWVFIGMLPVMAFGLGHISLLAPLANLVLVPLFSVAIVPLNLLALLSSFLSASLSSLLWQIADQLLVYAMNWLDALVTTLTGFNAVLPIANPHWGIKLLFLFGIVIVLLPKGLPLRWLALPLLLLPLKPTPTINEGDLVLTALDVGQGLAVIVQTRDHVLVYDVGPRFGDDFNTAEAVVIPFLKHQGIRRIDRLVISHGDNDHAGAWPHLAEQFPIGKLQFGEALPERFDGATSPCQRGAQWHWNRIRLEYLHPAENDHYRSANNRSCVLKITAGKHRFLLPGDIEAMVENTLINQQPEMLAATVLLAPHHGSHSSSSWPFIKRVAPEYVIFSSGYRNRFHHPAEVVVNRYRALGSKTLSTAEGGAIRISVINGQLQQPVQHRSSYRKYWQLGAP